MESYYFCLEKAVPGKMMEQIIDLIAGESFNEFRQDLAVAFEEAFMNVCRHAYKKDGPIIVRLEISKKKIAAYLCDCGKKFNPIKSPMLPLYEEGREGGHGIRIMRAYCNMSYMRIFGFNILKLWGKVS